jgi:hypothetical protein
MNLLPRQVGFLVAIFSALMTAPLAAQNAGGWKATYLSNSRHDAAAQVPAPQAAAAP